MNKIKFNVAFRSPKYPVFVVSIEKLCSAFNIDELAVCCISSSPLKGKTYIQVIDSIGEEFWYSPNQYVLSPGFESKKWTKKRIIEAYNSSLNAQLSDQSYSMKSISSKRLDKIIKDICIMLRS